MSPGYNLNKISEQESSLYRFRSLWLQIQTRTCLLHDALNNITWWFYLELPMPVLTTIFFMHGSEVGDLVECRLFLPRDWPIPCLELKWLVHAETFSFNHDLLVHVAILLFYTLILNGVNSLTLFVSFAKVVCGLWNYYKEVQRYAPTTLGCTYLCSRPRKWDGAGVLKVSLRWG